MPTIVPPDKTYRGPYAKTLCKHCGDWLEAGPKVLANWLWCPFCEAPVHKTNKCAKRCPKVGHIEHFNVQRIEDKLQRKFEVE